MSNVSVRYIVDDVDAAVDFYTSQFQFEVGMRPGPGFAMLRRGALRLLLNSPGGGGGAGQTLEDGSQPAPGGWNRIQLPVNHLDDTVASLRDAGVELRGEVITGRGGRQALVRDPSGNLVELFEAYS
ncbi:MULTISPECIES: VOC family protein [unclassified Mycobacterium]|uniref:VOC family protein n=1 Tax=unclassified Mycobacterium TaxID=2642494 RepID=UPI00073FB8A2|nr:MULTISPECIES: VOC family protein [unclassified Mycobacterium]KUH88869.1 glyoxalase [Mycobacterium sp. GA-0227b]KUH91163.1 glyoxalase [Mycobacterium sp. GA-1999]KUH95515.1 glyoxalase [Mycobacterium sp. IS-1556]